MDIFTIQFLGDFFFLLYLLGLSYGQTQLGKFSTHALGFSKTSERQNLTVLTEFQLTLWPSPVGLSKQCSTEPEE